MRATRKNFEDVLKEAGLIKKSISEVGNLKMFADRQIFPKRNIEEVRELDEIHMTDRVDFIDFLEMTGAYYKDGSKMWGYVYTKDGVEDKFYYGLVRFHIHPSGKDYINGYSFNSIEYYKFKTWSGGKRGVCYLDFNDKKNPLKSRDLPFYLQKPFKKYEILYRTYLHNPNYCDFLRKIETKSENGTISDMAFSNEYFLVKSNHGGKIALINERGEKVDFKSFIYRHNKMITVEEILFLIDNEDELRKYENTPERFKTKFLFTNPPSEEILEIIQSEILFSNL